MAAQVGQLIGERYRLEQRLSSAPPGEAPQGELWRASDQLVAEAPMALRLLGPGSDPERARQRWGRIQGVLHPQVPRLGPVIPAAEGLWLVREWQAGRTYQQLLAARAERQLVFGAGEVLLLLRQLLPMLVVLHSQELVHGDLSPANLLRRDSDGLPVLLDFGLVAGTPAATPGYAPPERARAAEPEPWMDLHALGVVALVLLSGEQPARLLDPVTLAWRWPACLIAEPALQAQIARLLERDSGERFASASQALAAFQTLPMPESTGPVARADRTVALVPPPVAAALPVPEPPPAPEPPRAPEPAAPESADPAPEPELPPLSPPPPLTPPPAAVLRSRLEEREEAAEGGIWPVVIALVLSAVVGTALGWWWLSRGRLALPTPDAALQLPNSLPPAEVDQRQQLLNRLRAMQVDRGWFLKLVDASLLAQFPERGGRLPSDSLEDAPLRKVWNELAEEWLARVEQLPLEIRRRLGSYTNGDWERRQQALVSQGLSPAVLRQLVSGSAQSLLPGRPGADIPAEPFRQLWFAAAEQSLANVQIEAIQAQPQETRVLSAQVEAGGARLFPVRLPAGYRLVLGVNGSPLMQMSVFGPDGDLVEAKGPLRVVSLGPQKRSPVQLLVTNEGVAPALITLSLRADPPAEAPQASPQPPAAQPQTPLAPQVPAAPEPPPVAPSAPPPPAPPPVN
jgi:serine/threonine-protein kinase